MRKIFDTHTGAYFRKDLKSNKKKSYQTVWITENLGYRRIVSTYKHGNYVSIILNSPTGPRRIDTALTVKKAKQRIKEYAASPLLFKF